tara:strand:- start:10533 stop:11606 length:1074 start_codon:yes stop_codon:yes gene_type:complete
LNKKKILFVIPSLRAGGAERVISFLADNLDSKYFDCKLVIIGYVKDSVYKANNSSTIYLNKPRLIFSFFTLIKIIRNDRPDIVFSSISHVNLLMAVFSFFFLKVSFVAREASVLTAMMSFGSFKSKLSQKLISYLYPRFSKIICQSSDMKKDLLTNFFIPEENMVVINNPITNETKFVTKQPSIEKDLKFITVGRLSAEKGYQRILKGLANSNLSNFQYTVIGSGALKNQLLDLVSKLKIQDKVIFIEYTGEVLKYLSNSDFFLQGSFVEGFPNALLESLSVGTPAIAFNCPGGTKEILMHGVNGYLVSDEMEFMERIIEISSNPTIFNRKVVRESVISKFSAKEILKKYSELFLKM